MADKRLPVVGGSRAAARVRKAAVEVFAEYGFHAATTREIADRLQMSAAALYPHFSSKESLLFAIILEGHQEALAAVVDSDPGGHPSDRLEAVVASFARWHADNHLIARVAQYELTELSPEHLARVSRIRSRTSGLIRQIVEDGAAHGEFDCDDPPGATLAILSLCIDICRWFPTRSHPSADSLAGLYSCLALRIVGERRSTQLKSKRRSSSRKP